MKPIHYLINLFFPKVCLCCSVTLTINEEIICVECRHDLPLTNFSFESNNLVEKTFYGRAKVESATALFYFFKKSKVQTLVHELKYRNQQQVGTLLGNWLGSELKNNERFRNLYCVIPVPLHKKKLKARGYNQLTTFGHALSQILEIPYNSTILLKRENSKTQTKKSRIDRWSGAQESFYCTDYTKLEGKHVLLIDDIITTGATLEACCKELSKTNGLKISIACMAYTK